MCCISRLRWKLHFRLWAYHQRKKYKRRISYLQKVVLWCRSKNKSFLFESFTQFIAFNKIYYNIRIIEYYTRFIKNWTFELLLKCFVKFFLLYFQYSKQFCLFHLGVILRFWKIFVYNSKNNVVGFVKIFFLYNLENFRSKAN